MDYQFGNVGSVGKKKYSLPAAIPIPVAESSASDGQGAVPIPVADERQSTPAFQTVLGQRMAEQYLNNLANAWARRQQAGAGL